jgi:hypothetical protein
MKPRMGSSLGCPYGQELEFLDGGLALSGSDFFWTVGKPIAQFEVGDEALGQAAKAWKAFLESGRLSREQVQAASAASAEDLLIAFKME